MSVGCALAQLGRIVASQRARPGLLGRAALVALLVAAPGTAAPERAERTSNPLVGTWQLEALGVPRTPGEDPARACCGLFVFSADGHAAVQVMSPPDSPDTEYSHGGYEATYGTYRVDRTGKRFTIHVEGAVVRTLIGHDLDRSFEVKGDRLIIGSTRADEHWQVVWRRAR